MNRFRQTSVVTGFFTRANNNNNDNNHVWNGINSNIRNQQPNPPQRKKLENLTFLETLDDKSGAILMVKDPNNINSDTFQCKFGKIDLVRIRKQETVLKYYLILLHQYLKN